MKITLSKTFYNSGQNVLGLDLSLRGTGICVLNDKGELIHRELIQYKERSIKKVKYAYFNFVVNGKAIDEKDISSDNEDEVVDKIKRLSAIKNRILVIAKDYKIKNVLIEDYAYDAKGRTSFGRVIDLGELGGVVKAALYENNYKVYKLSPTSLKKFITSDGLGSKENMAESIFKKYGYQFKDDNEADAFALARCLLNLGEEVYLMAKSGGVDLYLELLEKQRQEKIKATIAKKENKFSKIELKRIKFFFMEQGVKDSKKISQNIYEVNLSKKIKIKDYDYEINDAKWMPRRKDSFKLFKVKFVVNKKTYSCYLMEMFNQLMKDKQIAKSKFLILAPVIKELKESELEEIIFLVDKTRLKK